MEAHACPQGAQVVCARGVLLLSAQILWCAYRYQFDGTITRFGRRDMRRGKAYGRAEPTPMGVVCMTRWDEPMSGWGTEVFKLMENGVLEVESNMEMNGQHVQYRTLYTKR